MAGVGGSVGWIVVAAGAAACAAALAGAPPADAAQGSDSISRGDYVQYTADPGEANRFTAEDQGYGLHLNDPGAIIRWTTVPTLSECVGVVHDVYCSDQAGGFQMGIDLGDGDDSFVSRSRWAARVQLGPGDDSAVGGDYGYSLDGGPGADDLHGGAVDPANGGYVGQQVTYEQSPGPVTVSADDVANDGAEGEGDNVHSDVREVVGSPFADVISGFGMVDAGEGDDTITGGSGDDSLQGAAGNDTLVGGAGSDRLSDYSGDNTFNARDGEPDHIWCGSGYDRVYADAQDVIESPLAYGGDCDDVQVG